MVSEAGTGRLGDENAGAAAGHERAELCCKRKLTSCRSEERGDKAEDRF